jgi:hypothetical protein
MNNVNYGMGLRVAEHADRVREAMRVLVEYNVDVAVPPAAGGLSLEIAQRLVDNATVLLEQAKIYQRRLKAHKRQADRNMARWAREASKPA